jgi:APA family basic amino acid/polyamine antiporter
MTKLQRSLTTVEYFTFGFGTMVGVGWLVLMDDWLGRGGPAGAALGFLIGGLLLAPIAVTYGHLVREVPDAGAEIAYAEGALPSSASFGSAWAMVLAYAIVCPWEAVAVGNLLARVFPGLNSVPLYELAGKEIYLPRLVLGLLLTLAIAVLNLNGIKPSGLFQDVMTFALLAIFVLFTALGFAHGNPANWRPAFAREGTGGAALSVLLVLQIVPYFLTGFESVGKGSEEARAGFDPRGFGRAILLALGIGAAFYVTIVAVVSYVFPWREIVAGHIGTEKAFERAFSSAPLARLIVLAAFLSLVKIMNGNFVAGTRLLFGIGKRGLVHPALARVDARSGAPTVAIVALAVFTALASLLGDALLVPVSEVGSLAAGVGWLSACAAYLVRSSRSGGSKGPRALAAIGAVVAALIIAMKVIPSVPGSFTPAEWTAFAFWALLGLALYVARPRPARA